MVSNEDEAGLDSSAKKIVVLGTSHQLQGKNFPKAIDDQCYRDIVEQLISTFRIDFVFEEAAGRVPTDAELMVKSWPSPIGYMDIDPPEHEREKHGLSAETGSSFVVDLWQLPPCVAQTEFVDEHAAREEFWCKRISSQNFTCALVVCGHAHCLSLSFRLQGDGFKVENCINYIPHAKLCGHVVHTA